MKPSQFSIRLLGSTMALAMSIGLTACGGDKANEPAADAKKAETAEASKEAPKKEEAKKEATEAGATEATGDVIRIATEGAYPPMNFTNPDGTLGGFDVDVSNALCEQMKAKCEIVAQDWDGIIPGLKAKKYDAIVAGMSITDERKKVVDFTDRYFSSGLIVIAKKGSDTSLKNAKNVGAQRSTVASQYLEDEHKGVSAKLYDTQENANIDLLNGRLDAIVVDQIVGTDWLSKDGSKDYEQKGEVILTGKDDFGIAIRKGDTELANKFNTALKEIKGNGTYETISQKYFGNKTK